MYTILWPGKLPQSILLNVIMLLCYYGIAKTRNGRSAIGK